VKVKLDENLPVSLAALLNQRGHDTDTVLSEGLLGHEDPDVATAAKAADRMLMTLDKGFGDIRAYPPGTHPGIIVFRLTDEAVDAVRQAITKLVDDHPLEGFAGAVVVVQRGRIRVRRAP
jgi:predicted nuclease of predicted toxin-antitoxin system